MRRGLAVSLLLHVTVLAWALISFHATPPFRLPEPEPVEVALVTPDDIVRLKQGDRRAKELEAQKAESARQAKKENPKPVQAAAPPPPSSPPPPPPAEKPEPAPPEPPKAEAQKPEPPKPEPTRDPIAEKLASVPPEPEGPSLEEQARQAEEKKRAEEAQKAEEARKADEARKAEEKRRAEEKKKAEEAKKRLEHQKKLAEERRKAQEAKKKFDAERIAALLNKVPDKGAPPSGQPDPPVAPTKAKGPAAGAPEGRDSRLTASQRSLIGAMMRQAVKQCWNINSGLDGFDRVIVEVEVRLKPDGRLAQPPRVVNNGPGPLFADAANSALRAVLQCEPYDLPAQFYEGGWDYMVVTFDPRHM